MATKHQLRYPQQGQEGLRSIAWDLDAAQYTNYAGPSECSCLSKEDFNMLLHHLYNETPQVDCVDLIWALNDAWDAPTPEAYIWEIPPKPEFC